jgi:eukaryotic-like serine/threonine-protein kinase
VIGSVIGPYRVVEKIGAGGMGEVYLATDTNLGRQVAIKVLPSAVAADAERLARFDREARTLAAINHPNIAAIYGVERAAHSTALVMELVDGPTLADRIAQGPLPLDEALPIAQQIAEALEAAHDQGIVHRDLKPANIKLRPDGVVKVLDFGLAKTVESVVVPSGSGAGRSRSPTITSPAMTQAGMLLGTAAYMSPEQAHGRTVDKRADIWAFGCVLFEMVTGRRAFGGEDITETLAAIVKDQPLLNDVPGPLRTLIGRCLEKDPRRRLRDIGDAMSLAAVAGPSPDEPYTRRRQWLGVAGWVVAGVLLAAFAIATRGRPATGGEMATPVVRSRSNASRTSTTGRQPRLRSRRTAGCSPTTPPAATALRHWSCARSPRERFARSRDRPQRLRAPTRSSGRQTAVSSCAARRRARTCSTCPTARCGRCASAGMSAAAGVRTERSCLAGWEPVTASRACHPGSVNPSR